MRHMIGSLVIFMFVVLANVLVASGPPVDPRALQHELHSLEGPRTYDGPPLTLAGAVDEALAKNPGLIALRMQFEAARHRPGQERFLMPPTFEAQIWQWPINTLNPANTNMYMFMLNQDLPGRGKRELRAAVAEKDVEMATNDIAIRARQIVGEVKQRYAELFIARKAIDIHWASVDLLRQFADVSEAKYATGRISQQDVLKAVVELSKLHSDVIMFDEQAQLAAARLNTLLDRGASASIGPLAEPLERVLLPPAEELQHLALTQQPELTAARIDIERSEAASAVAKRDYKPDFSVQGGYLVVPHQSDALLARVGITWPNAPWSHGKIDARVAETTAAIEAARARQRSAEHAVQLAVQEAYVRVSSAQQRAELLRTSVLPQSRQTVDVSLAAYQTERGDFLALLDNQRTLLSTQLEYFKALSDFEQALGDLERAIGADLPPAMTEPFGTEGN
jgi:outer membrane protein, heavy metal efflux system